MADPIKQEMRLGAGVIIDAVNIMGYDAVGIGSGELALGSAPLVELRRKTQVPFVSANVSLQDDSPMCNSWVVKESRKLRWGIFSLMSAKTVSPNPEGGSQDWRVLDPLQTGKAVVAELKKKTDRIILLADMSIGEIKQLVAEFGDISIVVATHRASGMRTPLQVGQTIVVSSGGNRYLGRLDLSIRDPEGPFVDQATISRVARQLALVKKRAAQGDDGSSEKMKTQLEAQLKELGQKNVYRNQPLLLSARVKEDNTVNRLVRDYHAELKKARAGCGEK